MTKVSSNPSYLVQRTRTLAVRVKPGLLVLYHRANAGGALSLADPEQALLHAIRELYKGPVITAHDLDVF